MAGLEPGQIDSAKAMADRLIRYKTVAKLLAHAIYFAVSQPTAAGTDRTGAAWLGQGLCGLVFAAAGLGYQSSGRSRDYLWIRAILGRSRNRRGSGVARIGFAGLGDYPMIGEIGFKLITVAAQGAAYFASLGWLAWSWERKQGSDAFHLVISYALGGWLLSVAYMRLSANGAAPWLAVAAAIFGAAVTAHLADTFWFRQARQRRTDLLSWPASFWLPSP